MYKIGDEIIILNTECTDLKSGQICHIIDINFNDFYDCVLIRIEEFPHVALNSIRFADITYHRRFKLQKLKKYE